MTPTRDLCEEPTDDMPPLVEPMTYTFLTEMPPLLPDSTASLDATFASTAPSATIEELDSGEQSYTFSGPTRTYHGKRHDASYIPRPPNAFILFRSSFIREQQVPINVVGNHSNLSKIVGMFWNKLPKSERDSWEAKAAQAQVEHRRRYPDWRFQPSANAAANAKERRYVLNRGGGDGGGGGAKKNVGLRMGTKDPPDRGGDEEVQDFQDGEDEEEFIDDDDDDSDYEEGARWRRKRKGKRKTRAGSTRTRESVKIIKPKAKPALVTSRDKERIERIVGFLVEGKKGAELEEAVEEWDKDGRRSSTAARCNVDPDKGKVFRTINQIDVQAPCDSVTNCQLKTKPLPSIITIKPSPPSAPSSMPAPTPHSPVASLLSPVLTLSHTVPPPSSPEPYHEEAQGQVQGIKRSFSAPAPGIKFEVPQVQIQMQGQSNYMPGERQVQLGYGQAPGVRKRKCSSASVPGSIGEPMAGKKNKEMLRRETVSLPLTRLDAGPRRWGYTEPAYGENHTGTVPDLQGFSVQGQGVLMGSAFMDDYVAPTTTAPAFRGEGGHMSVGHNSNVVSDATLDHYYLTSPASPPSTYATTSTSWWLPTVSFPVNSQSTDEQYEPVREGSFEPPCDYEYPYSYETPGKAEYNNVYGDITQVGSSLVNLL
ncbi:hypothetical protein C0993_009371 [Termitomyces sp. T159_Od127]|nr:hypothetical protein C0993_009371 [Termitomyces sp. T159_Od127]